MRLLAIDTKPVVARAERAVGTGREGLGTKTIMIAL